jgi:hypothetical protein
MVRLDEKIYYGLQIKVATPKTAGEAGKMRACWEELTATKRNQILITTSVKPAGWILENSVS